MLHNTMILVGLERSAIHITVTKVIPMENLLDLITFRKNVII